MENKSVTETLDERQKRVEQGPWLPACGGTEQPFFTRSGHKLLYCWQPSTGKHAYLNMWTDMILADEEAQAIIGI